MKLITDWLRHEESPGPPERRLRRSKAGRPHGGDLVELMFDDVSLEPPIHGHVYPKATETSRLLSR
jgi:hypothetical protein